MKSLLTLTTLALAASPLSAIILSIPFQSQTLDIVTGQTFLISSPGGPVYHGTGIGSRVLEDLSGVSGEAPTFYNTFTFTPTATSGDPFTFAAQYGVGVDGFMALYVNSFNPASPLTNALIANNDAGLDPAQSSFSFGLTAGVTYVLVHTLNNGDVTGSNPAFNPLRSINTNIGGPGSLDYTPPPPEGIPFGVDSTLGLAVLGAIGALRLRRNRKA